MAQPRRAPGRAVTRDRGDRGTHPVGPRQVWLPPWLSLGGEDTGSTAGTISKISWSHWVQGLSGNKQSGRHQGPSLYCHGRQGPAQPPRVTALAPCNGPLTPV